MIHDRIHLMNPGSTVFLSFSRVDRSFALLLAARSVAAR